jgi:hypothetical protein
LDDILKSVEVLKKVFDPIDIPAVFITMYLVQILKPVFKLKQRSVQAFALVMGFILSPWVLIIYQDSKKVKFTPWVLAAYIFMEGLKLGIGSIFVKTLWNKARVLMIRSLGGVEKK